MNSPEPITTHAAARGRFQVAVINPDGSYAQPFGPWQSNLILDSGLDFLATKRWCELVTSICAGTGNTPTKDLPDGYYTQAGTTVTRETGTRDFISGDVGKLIRFSDGTERKITAFIDATNVTVGTTGTVPATPGSTTITAAASTVSDFTITAAAHGKEIGDRIVIAGVTPAGYNGNWTVASKTTNTITVTSVANPGTGTVFGTVATAALSTIIYRVNQTGLATEAKRSNTPATFTDTDGRSSNCFYITAAAATLTYRRTVDMTAEVGNVNYTELGISPTTTAGANLFSRILLSGAVTVLTGQQLRVKYELTVKIGGALTAEQATVSGGFTGWPRPYNIASITSSGSDWTLTLPETHHYVAGGKINIDGALRPKTTITAAASTVSDFTITAAAHGRSPGDSITIEGVSPSGYNGTFTIASTTTDTITVTSALNPGTGTVFGTVRQATPSPWYDGEHTIASVTSTTVVITSALSIADAGASGTAYNDTKRKLVPIGYGLIPRGTGINSELLGTTDGNLYGCLFGSDNSDGGAGVGAGYGGLNEYAVHYYIGVVTAAGRPSFLPLGFPRVWFDSNTSGPQNGSPSLKCHDHLGVADSGAAYRGGYSLARLGVAATYTAGNHYQDIAFTFTAAELNITNIRQFHFQAASTTQGALEAGTAQTNSPMAYCDFEQPQRKDNTHKLTVTLRRTWGRDLTIEAS